MLMQYVTCIMHEEEEETLLIYTAQGSPFRRKKAVCYQWEPSATVIALCYFHGGC